MPPLDAPAPAASATTGTTAPAVLVTATPLPATGTAPAATPLVAAAAPVPLPAAQTPAQPEKFLLLVDTTAAPLDDSLVAEAVAKAQATGFKLVHYAPCAHPALKAYARLHGLAPVKEGSTEGAIAHISTVEDPHTRYKFPAAELFDPYVAETLYKEAHAAKFPPAPAAKPPGGAPVGTVAAALMLFALLVLGTSGCKTSGSAAGANTTASVPTAASATPPPSATLPAKIGAAALKLETPQALQFEVQVTVSEVLQRAVAAGKQADTAAWVTNAAKGLQSFTGTTPPTGAQVQAVIAQYAGPTQDPNLVLLSATIADGWDLALPAVKAAIAANPTAVRVEDYAQAAARGALAGSAGYLAK